MASLCGKAHPSSTKAHFAIKSWNEICTYARNSRKPRGLCVSFSVTHLLAQTWDEIVRYFCIGATCVIFWSFDDVRFPAFLGIFWANCISWNAEPSDYASVSRDVWRMMSCTVRLGTVIEVAFPISHRFFSFMVFHLSFASCYKTLPAWCSTSWDNNLKEANRSADVS